MRTSDICKLLMQKAEKHSVSQFSCVAMFVIWLLGGRYHPALILDSCGVLRRANLFKVPDL